MPCQTSLSDYYEAVAELAKAVARLSNKQLGSPDEGELPCEEPSPELLYSFGTYKTFEYPRPSHHYTSAHSDLDQFCTTYGLTSRIKEGLTAMGFKPGDRLDHVMNYTHWSCFFEPFEWKKVLDAIEDYWVDWLEHEEMAFEAQRNELLYED